MMTDVISPFKHILVDHLKAHGIVVKPTAIRISNGDFSDVLVHCGKASCEDNTSDIIKKQTNSASKLKICSITMRRRQLIIKLNRLSAFSAYFRESHTTDASHLMQSNIQNERINLIHNTDRCLNDLTNFRIHVIVQTMENLMRTIGYDVRINEPNAKGLYFSYKSNLPNNSAADHTLVLCGPVLNACGSTKERNMTMEDYKKMKKTIFHQQMEHRNNVDENVNEILTDAVIKFEFLRVKSSSPIILNLKEMETSFAGSAVFVLYNYSRLNAIIHEFETRVQLGTYPPLPLVEEIDFSLLREEKEWTLMFNYVMRFPVLLNEITQFIREGRPSPHLLCSFLFAFVRTISSYYRSTKILLEANASLLPLVYARIYLIKAIKRILLSGLELMNIKAVPVL